ncbi:MAG: hypothetical protein AB1941_04170 [Gemmatimonadota bacterium]
MLYQLSYSRTSFHEDKRSPEEREIYGVNDAPVNARPAFRDPAAASLLRLFHDV